MIVLKHHCNHIILYFDSNKDIYIHKMGKEIIYRVDKLQSVKVGYTGDALTCEYPKNFFVNKKKPDLTIYTLPEGRTLDDLRKSVMVQVTTGSYKIKEINTYIYLVGKTITEDLASTWTSYGIDIGKSGESINPWSVYSVQEIPDAFVEMNTQSEATYTDLWLMVFFNSFYRLSRASLKQYKTILITKIMDQLKSLSTVSNLQDPDFNETFITNIGNNQTYRKLIAGLDMFLNKFTDNEYSIVRLGTVASRFRDCAALQSYTYASRLLGFTSPGMLLRWIFTERIAEEAGAMFKEDEEFDIPHSYFMYQVDMGIVSKSAFSATANPGIYFFTNLIGAMINDGRGLRARYLASSDVPSTLQNSTIVAYVHTRYANMSQRYTDVPRTQENVDQHKKDMADKRAKRYDISLNDDEPAGTDINAWIIFFEENNYQLTESMQVFLEGVKKKITNPRAGTVGEFLSTA
uniref:Nucleoprotein n=3 Tax=unclassified Sigmavirus TaxID=1802944 RepID=A0AAU7L0L4_9RHAB